MNKNLKYLKYVLINLYINFKIKKKIILEKKQNFIFLLVCSKLNHYISSSATINCSKDGYLRLGYEKCGVSDSSNSGISLELHDNSCINIVGKNLIGYGSSIRIYNGGKLNLGGGTYIAGRANIGCVNEITIGANCNISWNVTILDSDFHPWRKNEINQTITKKVRIGDHVWIGNNVIILKGVTIGENCIIGAGSVVTRNIPKNCMATGNPAKVISDNISW